MQRLGAAQSHAKACHHFIVNQHRAVLLSQAAQGLNKLSRWLHHVHIACNRLQNHTGNFVTDLAEGVLQLFHIVVSQHDGVFGKIGRHTG